MAASVAATVELFLIGLFPGITAAKRATTAAPMFIALLRFALVIFGPVLPTVLAGPVLLLVGLIAHENYSNLDLTG